MIIENGKILVRPKSGGGVDSENNPVSPTYGAPVEIPCQYQQKRRSNTGEYEGGHYTSSSYDVYIDIENLAVIGGEGKFTLVSNTTGNLGEFEFAKPDVLELVGQIKISV